MGEDPFGRTSLNIMHCLADRSSWGMSLGYVECPELVRGSEALVIGVSAPGNGEAGAGLMGSRLLEFRVAGILPTRDESEQLGRATRPRHIRCPKNQGRPKDDGGGITPAYAGRTSRCPDRRAIAEDHPRVCGENALGFADGGVMSGSPPRMRGELTVLLESVSCDRITPAYAGRTTCRAPPPSPEQDHPRVCGENHRGCAPD